MDPHKYVETPSRPTLLLMRHPETEANAAKQYLGWRNIALTPLGEQQRQRAVEGLINWKPDRIISSPLERCRLIAEDAANRLGLPLAIDERVKELGFGRLEGKNYSEVIAEGLPFPWGETMDQWPCEGGESFEDFTERLGSAASEYAAYDGRTAVVAHGGVVRGLTGIWMGMQPGAYWQMSVRNVNSAIFTFSEGNAYLERFGIEPEQLGAGI